MFVDDDDVSAADGGSRDSVAAVTAPDRSPVGSLSPWSGPLPTSWALGSDTKVLPVLQLLWLLLLLEELEEEEEEEEEEDEEGMTRIGLSGRNRKQNQNFGLG